MDKSLFMAPFSFFLLTGMLFIWCFVKFKIIDFTSTTKYINTGIMFILSYFMQIFNANTIYRNKNAAQIFTELNNYSLIPALLYTLLVFGLFIFTNP